MGSAFGEAMRLLAGADVAAGDAAADAADAEWAQVVAGPWLAETLKGLRSPEGLAQVDPGAALKGTLRPYQQVGVRWLYLLAKLGLGACLADDMGLGKTIQVLSLLLVLKRQADGKPQPSLLVAPASLLANWAAEIERFAPGLKALIAHPSALPAAELKALAPERLQDVDLVITSYGSLLRVPWIAEVAWRLVVLDEAQAIKNPDAKQTRAVKKLKARRAIGAHRHARREPAGRSVVHFRLRQPGAAGIGEGVHELRQTPGEQAPQFLRPAARTGAAVHSAALEDRQDGDRGPAGQDRDQGVLPAQPQAGRASTSRR